jgi:hypothetical protein
MVASPSAPCPRGRPPGSRNKKTLAAIMAATAAAGGLAAATATAAGPSRHPPARQSPTYTSVNGYVTFLVLVLAWSEDRLCLPFKFVEAM